VSQSGMVEIVGADVLIIAIVVWFVGTFLTKRISVLERYNIPAAVTGGLLCSLVVTAIYVGFDRQISFDMRLRDILLLVFFSTIGLSAKLRLLAEGGKALAILLAVAAVFLIVQDLTGVLLTKLMGVHPAYGLFGGSISLAGGHGTAIAWGVEAEAAGLSRAKEIGLAFATFGLIAGGVIGGPIGELLIRRNGLSDVNQNKSEIRNATDELMPTAAPLSGVLGTLLMLAICVEAGDLVNRLLFSRGVTLPGFLTAMMVGIVLTNGADLIRVKLSDPAIERAGEISLQLFLCMSLMSMQLWTLVQAIGPILFVLSAQMLVMTLFAVMVVFRVMGRDYDAGVIATGFVGLGLGATPVGIANMNAITSKYGPSPKAYLVIPLIGAFFIDLTNALIIKFFVGLPIISQTPIPGAL
jgi:ESS family glutamate:Na+ symporter